jgi:hypothetical protein
LAEPMAIDGVAGGAVIMTVSGMCTGGRVRHRPRRNLAREQRSVVFVGCAAEGTLARSTVDGARAVRIVGEEIAVRARFRRINALPRTKTRRNGSPGMRAAAPPGRSSCMARRPRCAASPDACAKAASKCP